MYDRDTKRPRGFGFVTFTAEDSVDTLVKQRFVEVNNKSVEIKAALPKATMESNRRSRGNIDQNRQAQMPYGQYGAYANGNFPGYNPAYVPRGGGYPASYAAAYGGNFQAQARGGYNGASAQYFENAGMCVLARWPP
jgi:RNA-binding protein Musashi